MTGVPEMLAVPEFSSKKKAKTYLTFIFQVLAGKKRWCSLERSLFVVRKDKEKKKENKQK